MKNKMFHVAGNNKSTFYWKCQTDADILELITDDA